MHAMHRNSRLPRADGHAARVLPLRAALAALTVALLVADYHLLGNTVESVHSRSVFVWMVARWSDKVSFGADYSIGWLVPLISLGLVWRRRRALVAAPRRVVWPGLAAVLLALLLHWAGARIQQPRVSLTSLILLLWAIPGSLYGPAVGRLLLFPCAYLAFCIPWNFLDALTFPLRLFSSVLSAALLNGIGIGVARAGTMLRSTAPGGFDFNVADPCSGLSSMLAMAAVAALYAHLTQRTLGRKLLLFAAAVPIAVAANVFRICTVAVTAVVAGEAVALTLYHDYSAFLIFPFAVLLMLACGSLVQSFRWSIVRTWIAKQSRT